MKHLCSRSSCEPKTAIGRACCSAPVTVFSAQLGLLLLLLLLLHTHTYIYIYIYIYMYYYEKFSVALLHAENIKHLFCTTVCSLMMSQCGPKRVAVGVL